MKLQVPGVKRWNVAFHLWCHLMLFAYPHLSTAEHDMGRCTAVKDAGTAGQLPDEVLHQSMPEMPSPVAACILPQQKDSVECL